MKIKKLIATLLSCLLLVTLLSSCSLTDYKIEGTWKELGSYVGLCQFNSDGTFEIEAVGYYITGTYESTKGEQKEVDGKQVLEGTISMEYKDVTYTDKDGKKVTEPYTFECVTTEIEKVTVEKPNPFNPEKIQLVEEEVKTETVHKGKLAGPISGTYTINEQNTNAEALTIYLDGEVTFIDSNGEQVSIKPDESKWKFERSYDKI